MEEIFLPKTLSKLGGLSFYGCSSLKSVQLPSRVHTIGHSAFRECTNLQEIYLPKSLSSVGVLSFSGCTSLKKVFDNGNLEDWNKIDFPTASLGGDKNFLQNKLILNN